MKARLAAMSRVAALGLLLALSGVACARPDWIESTLVTSDVTGQWQGVIVGGGGRQVQSPIELQLTQSGARVSGTFIVGAISTAHPLRSTGELEGTINGDVLRFRQVGGELTGELTVGIDEMSGWLVRPPFSGRITTTLKRQ